MKLTYIGDDTTPASETFYGVKFVKGQSVDLDDAHPYAVAISEHPWMRKGEAVKPVPVAPVAAPVAVEPQVHHQHDHKRKGHK